MGKSRLEVGMEAREELLHAHIEGITTASLLICASSFLPKCGKQKALKSSFSVTGTELFPQWEKVLVLHMDMCDFFVYLCSNWQSQSETHACLFQSSLFSEEIQHF